MAGPSSTGNYARAGASVGRDAENLFKINRQNAPDMSAIVQEAAKRKAESEMKGYAIAADTLSNGLKEVTKTANYKQGIEAEAELKGAKRKAGVLAAAGGYLGTGIGGLGESGRTKREIGVGDAEYSAKTAEIRAKAEKIRNTPFDLN